MQAMAQTVPASKNKLWVGRIISAVVVAFLLFGAAANLMKLAPAVEGTVRLGYPVGLIFPIAVILLACVITYTIPRTSVLGAILLTGTLAAPLLLMCASGIHRSCFLRDSVCWSGQDCTCAMTDCGRSFPCEVRNQNHNKKRNSEGKS